MNENDDGSNGDGECRRGATGGERPPSTSPRDQRARADGGFDPGFFEQVVAEVGVGVGVYDDTGRFTYVNDAYADVLDRDREDLLGTAIWEVNPTVDRERFDEYWASISVGETRQTETVHVRPDGTEFPVETHTTAIKAEGTRYHVGTIADVTERVEGWRELERQDERLEKFASVVSHDLRNPLNVAMGRVRLAREDCDTDHLDPVENSLDRMEALIDDVISMAREGSRLTDPEPVSLRQVVTTAWGTVDRDAATLDVVDDLGVVASDESRLCEVFENLFHNAVEHAGPPVTVTVGLLEDGDGFYVADDGPGIDPDDRDQVFDYGYSTGEEGTGFGLAIVDQIAEAHGWTVALTASESGGARVEFRDVAIE